MSKRQVLLDDGSYGVTCPAAMGYRYAILRINLDLVKLGEPTNKKYEYVALINGGESWVYIFYILLYHSLLSIKKFVCFQFCSWHYRWTWGV